MASNSASYPLSRGFAASVRLNLQHFLHKKDLGFLVHPRIPLKADNLRIADLGTGTGIWLVDLHDQVPKSAKLDGFDISPTEFPPDDWTPESVTLEVLDAFGEVPERLQGIYDVVNIRFFTLMIRNNDPSQVIRNVFKMLKPGGYFQWTEFDNLDSSSITAVGVSAEVWNSLKTEVEAQTASDPSRFRWLTELPESLRQTGFTDVSMERVQVKKENYTYWQQTTMMVAEEMSNSISGGDRIRELIHETRAKTPKGVYWNRPHLVYLARKPI